MRMLHVSDAIWLIGQAKRRTNFENSQDRKKRKMKEGHIKKAAERCGPPSVEGRGRVPANQGNGLKNNQGQYWNIAIEM
jgi:hypothetical protein